jgi:hypothetical protein
MTDKLVGGFMVSFSPGYAQWTQAGQTYHINWQLGEGSIYHVTLEERLKVHYFFKLDAGRISDAVAPKGMKGQAGTSKKFSALPAAVQKYVTENITNLMVA